MSVRPEHSCGEGRACAQKLACRGDMKGTRKRECAALKRPGVDVRDPDMATTGAFRPGSLVWSRGVCVCARARAPHVLSVCVRMRVCA